MADWTARLVWQVAKALAPPGETGAEEEHWGELALKEGKSEEAVGVLPAPMQQEEEVFDASDCCSQMHSGQLGGLLTFLRFHCRSAG